MILISYITPYIIVQSDRLISGNMTIKNKKNQTIWSSQFVNKEYINIKAEPIWPKHLLVSVVVDGNKITKTITL